MKSIDKQSDDGTERPIIAVTLGWAGVLPFAALSCLAVAASADTAEMARHALIGYGAIILGFMGGVQWGLEMTLPYHASGTGLGYAASVTPALVAFAATLAPLSVALWILMAGFGGLLAYDLQRLRQGIGARWYATLRWQLSLAVIAALLVAAMVGVGNLF